MKRREHIMEMDRIREKDEMRTDNALYVVLRQFLQTEDIGQAIEDIKHIMKSSR